MPHTAPGIVNVDGPSKADVVIRVTMSEATAAKILRAVCARVPESAVPTTIEQAVQLALTWSKTDVRPPR